MAFRVRGTSCQLVVSFHMSSFADLMEISCKIGRKTDRKLVQQVIEFEFRGFCNDDQRKTSGKLSN